MEAAEVIHVDDVQEAEEAAMVAEAAEMNGLLLRAAIDASASQ